MTASADLLIVGRIATLAGDRGPGWVEAIAVSGGRVVAAGPRQDVELVAEAGTRRIELAPDEAAVPGLTDAHLHLASAAMERLAVDLADVETVDGLIARVRAAADANPDPDSVIEGGGWDADTLGRWPTADDLERAAPGRKVGLWAHDHHALLVSARALREAGIDERGDPNGGVIRRDEHGRATGILHEKAAGLVSGLVPPPSAGVIAKAVDTLSAELVALGVVAVHDPGGLSPAPGLGGGIAAYRSLAEEGRLRLRVHACVRPEQLDAAIVAGLRSGAPMGPDPLDRLRLGWLKTFADGSLGSRTAALLEPLDPLPDEPPPPNDGFGVWMTPPEVLLAQTARAAANGIATQIHGIGDAAVRAALDALAGTAGATPLMPRVEHAQLVAMSDVPRFAQLGVAASMQPVHVRSDAEKARRLWGPRAEARGYALAAIALAGAVVVAGTDAPVEPIDPWPGVTCAVTRAAPGWPANTPPFGPGNALDLWASLRAWCVGPAVSAGEPDRGRLTPGQRADVVVLPAAALEEPVAVDGALWHARPRLVLMDGEVVAER
jgi:predicted amidohydrolase YtcJ